MADKNGLDEMKKPTMFDVIKLIAPLVVFVGTVFVFTERSGITAELAKKNESSIDLLQKDQQGNSYNIQSTTDALDKTNEVLDLMIEKIHVNTAEDAAAHGKIGDLRHDVERLEDRERRRD